MTVVIVPCVASPFLEKATLDFFGEKALLWSGPPREAFEKLWENADLFVCIGSLGIVVRLIAPFLKDKKEDPGILCVPGSGDFVIPLCGGHEKGVNALALRLARFLKAREVLTTASEAFGVFTPRELAERLGCALEGDRECEKAILGLLARGERVPLFVDDPFPLLPFPGYDTRPLTGPLPQTCLVLSERLFPKTPALFLRPKTLAVGLGFRKACDTERLVVCIRDFLESQGFALASLGELVSISRKAKDLALLAGKLGVQSVLVDEDVLRNIPAPSPSPCAEKHLGLPGVAEPVLLARGYTLLVPKTVYPEVALALGRKSWSRRGSLLLVSLGDGANTITLEALEALEEAEVILGYRAYLDLLPLRFRRRALYHFSQMKQEVERAKEALRLARCGSIVALVSGGDVGVFGAVSPALEMAQEEGIPFRVVPGVSAVFPAAASFGSPLVKGFAVVSLSDYLTPWEEIQRNLERLAGTDLTVSVYNIVGRGKEEKIAFLRETFARARGQDLPVGIVRKGGQKRVARICDLRPEDLDMSCLLLIPPRGVQSFGDTLIVPRGYRW